MIYFELFCLAVVVVYVVDLSGFIASLRSGIASAFGVKEEAVKLPLISCDKCMTWWCCLIYATLFADRFSVYLVAYIAVLSYFSVQIHNLLWMLREGFGRVIELCNQKFGL